MSTSDRAEWQLAFAKQAKADLNAWVRLEQMQDIAACCKLLFLYMACEKLAKAFLCATGSDPELIQSSHGYVAKVLPVIARQEYGLLVGRSLGRSNRKLQELKILAQEIAVLSPSVDRERRPDNCEYPWKDAQGKIQVPSEHSFPNLHLLYQPSGRTFIKLMSAAIAKLVR